VRIKGRRRDKGGRGREKQISRVGGSAPKKKRYKSQQRKEMDYDEPHLTPNEKPQPIQWTE